MISDFFAFHERETNNVHAEVAVSLSEWGSGMDAMTLRSFVTRNAPLGYNLNTDDNKSYRLMKGYHHA